MDGSFAEIEASEEWEYPERFERDWEAVEQDNGRIRLTPIVRLKYGPWPPKHRACRVCGLSQREYRFNTPFPSTSPSICRDCVVAGPRSSVLLGLTPPTEWDTLSALESLRAVLFHLEREIHDRRSRNSR